MSLSRESGSWLFVEKYEGHNILMQHLSVFLTLHHGKTYFYGNEIVNGTRRSLLGFFCEETTGNFERCVHKCKKAVK